MTGHVIIQTQNQTPTFLTTLQATLDILDDISGRIDENTYLTLTNNLQQLYNMHTSNPTSNANPPIITPINYTRNDISYASIRNFDISNANINNNINTNINNNINNNINTNINNNINANINNNTRNDYVSDISYASIRNFDISNANISNANISNIVNENIQSLNEESNRMGYSIRTRLALYGNVFGNA